MSLNEDIEKPTSSPVKPKLSHKQWRALQKKLKRKAQRQATAKERESNESPVDESEETLNESPVNFQTEQAHKAWLERERRALAEIEAKKLWELKEKQRREAEELKIKQEWEERQRLEKEEEAKKKEEEADRKKKHEKLLKEATANANTGDEWHNPLAPPTNSSGRVIERPHCPFFAKVGACRFGDRCSRFHDLPESSHTLLFPNMYSHFQLDQGLLDEFDTDLSLEYEESEVYQHFTDFYVDVLPEFKNSGRIVQFKVCCNYEPHLRGNVYVQYTSENAAMRAFAAFNGRWYGGKQLNCEFCNITKWKNAICGLFHQKRCPKGKNCNFLHVFRNPGNEFRDADFDFENSRRQSERRDKMSYAEYSIRSHRSRSRSPTPSYRHSSRRRRTRSRSRSRERHTSRQHSRPRDSIRHGSRSLRSRSRSPYRRLSRRRSRSTSRDRYRSDGTKDYNTSRSGSEKRSTYSRSSRTERDRYVNELSPTTKGGAEMTINSQSSYKSSTSFKRIHEEEESRSDGSSGNGESLHSASHDKYKGGENGEPPDKSKKKKKHKHKHKKHKSKSLELHETDGS